MELSGAIGLIDKAIIGDGKQLWADLGCGAGLFTKALSTLLQKESVIYAIDKDVSAIRSMPSYVNSVRIEPVEKDFVREPLGLELLDGVLMANSLHYVSDKRAFFETLKTSLKPLGKLIIVEYERDTSNQWVPYPITFAKLELSGHLTGFNKVVRLAEVQSVFNQGKIYAAALYL